MKKKILIFSILLNLTLATGSNAESLDTNLIHYWKMDNDSSDSIGSANGTDNNINYDEGLINECAIFNGSNSKIDITSNYYDTIFGSSDFSINIWIKSTTNDYSSFIENEGLGSTAGWAMRGRINSTAWWFQPYNDSGTGILEDEASFTDGNWHMFTVKRSDTTISAYFDGEYKNQITFLPEITANSGGIKIGYGSAYLNGNIDEIGIWTKSLSTEEIEELYNDGNGKTYPFTNESTSTPSIGSTTPATDSQNLHYMVGLGTLGLVFLLTDFARRNFAGLVK